MLTVEQNERLVRVGPGTPMGALLRHYWMPIAAESEFAAPHVKPVRLLGEDLVLYRDGGGQIGLVDRHCPHRRADLSYGYTETCGLRCNYHGWLFDADGSCLETPFDDVAATARKLRERVAIKAYPTAVHGGLIWAYLGPDPAPLVPDWAPFSWPNGFRQIVFSTVPCNWFQAQENSIDPVHFEWMHNNWGARLRGDDQARAAAHVKLGFEPFEHGFIYRRLREGDKETGALWTVGRVCLWPNAFFLGDHFEWRVPIDDETMLSVLWSFTRVPNEREPYVQQGIPAWEGPVTDGDGRWITSHIMNQDFVAWVGQGRIADRTREHLGEGDIGIVRMRQRFFREMDAVERGETPGGRLFDEAANRAVPLPVVGLDRFTNGLPLAAMRADPALARQLEGFIFQAGQPAEVRAEYAAAMGIDR